MHVFDVSSANRFYCLLSVVTSFYRAKRMHSAVYAVMRCLSVCLSVTLVYCVETTEIAIMQLTLDCNLL